MKPLLLSSLLLIACNTNPFKGEEHIWSSTTKLPEGNELTLGSDTTVRCSAETALLVDGEPTAKGYEDLMGPGIYRFRDVDGQRAECVPIEWQLVQVPFANVANCKVDSLLDGRGILDMRHEDEKYGEVTATRELLYGAATTLSIQGTATGTWYVRGINVRCEISKIPDGSGRTLCPDYLDGGSCFSP